MAARLAGGLPPHQVGPPVDVASLAPAPWREAASGPGVLYCQVVDVDRFGNLRLGAEAEMLEKIATVGNAVKVDLGEVLYDATVADTFGRVEPGAIVLYEDSSGLLGLAMREGNLADRSGARPLQFVTLYFG